MRSRAQDTGGEIIAIGCVGSSRTSYALRRQGRLRLGQASRSGRREQTPNWEASCLSTPDGLDARMGSRPAAAEFRDSLDPPNASKQNTPPLAEAPGATGFVE